MLHVLKSEVFIRGSGGGGGGVRVGTRPPLSEFYGSAPESRYSETIFFNAVVLTRLCYFMLAVV